MGRQKKGTRRIAKHSLRTSDVRGCSEGPKPWATTESAWSQAGVMSVEKLKDFQGFKMGEKQLNKGSV